MQVVRGRTGAGGACMPSDVEIDWTMRYHVHGLDTFLLSEDDRWISLCAALVGLWSTVSVMHRSHPIDIDTSPIGG